MKKHLLIATTAIVLLLGGVFTALELTHSINFIGSKNLNSTNNQTTSPEVRSANPTNTVDYGPANPSDNQPISDKSPDQQSQAVNNSLSATITSLRKNSDGSNYLIKVAVSGTGSGTCTAVATKGDLKITATSTIGVSGSQNSCIDLKIPSASFSEEGTWNVNVTITDIYGTTTEASSAMEVIL